MNEKYFGSFIGRKLKSLKNFLTIVRDGGSLIVAGLCRNFDLFLFSVSNLSHFLFLTTQSGSSLTSNIHIFP